MGNPTGKGNVSRNLTVVPGGATSEGGGPIPGGGRTSGGAASSTGRPNRKGLANIAVDVKPYKERQGRRGRRRSMTIPIKRLTREELRRHQADVIELGDYRRPKTRTECVDGMRPCPFVTCRYHLALDVNPETGSIKLNFPDMEVWQMINTCALDVADCGGITLEEVGEIMNLTRERIRQLEAEGLEQLKRAAQLDR